MEATAKAILFPASTESAGPALELMQKARSECIGQIQGELQASNQKLSSVNEMYKRLQEYNTSVQQYNTVLQSELAAANDNLINHCKTSRDSTYKYFEVILVDAAHNAIRNDPRINWICNPVHKYRELRRLTSAGKKNRGLRGKGHRNHKQRPSKSSTWKRNNTLSLRRYR
ncbi:hypothetical protein QQ045_030821 [Rhodiola kirilowii]